jgi:ankyrin repeat protein
MSGQFLRAVQAGDLAGVEALLRKDPRLKDARTPEGIHAAVVALYYGHGAVSKAILAHKPVLDLHAAASVGDLRRVRQLIEKDPSSVDAYAPDGFPPLGLAAYMGRAAVVEYLLSKGADVNQLGRNPGRFTALTGAVAAGHREVVKRLLEAGADPNYWYQGGLTPVLEAAAGGSLPILELLVAHGGDVTPETEQGKTAVSLAVEHEHPEVAEWLRKHGAGDGR